MSQLRNTLAMLGWWYYRKVRPKDDCLVLIQLWISILAWKGKIMKIHASEVFSPLFSQIADLAARSRGIAVPPRSFQLNSIEEEPKKAVRIIQQHKLEYGIHRLLSIPKNSESVSPKVKQQIRTSALVESAMKHRLFMDWNEIREAFTRNQIGVLIIKGPALSVQLYQDACMRGYTDLDLLVDIKDVCDTIPIMAQAGYRPKESDFETFCGAASWKDSPLVQKPHHLVFVREDSPYRIEIHTKLYDYLPSKYEKLHGVKELFSRNVVVSDKDTIIPTLSLLDHAVFMVDHGTRHGWCVLHWLLDFAKLLSMDDPQFHRSFIHQMQQIGRIRQLVLVLNIVHDVFGMPIPAQYNRINDEWKKRLSSQIHYVATGLAGRRNPGSLVSILKHSYGFKLVMSTSFLEMVHVLVGLLLISPQDVVRFPVPRILLPIHLIIRPLFVVSRRIKRHKELKNS